MSSRLPSYYHHPPLILMPTFAYHYLYHLLLSAANYRLPRLLAATPYDSYDTCDYHLNHSHTDYVFNLTETNSPKLTEPDLNTT